MHLTSSLDSLHSLDSMFLLIIIDNNINDYSLYNIFNSVILPFIIPIHLENFNSD